MDNTTAYWANEIFAYRMANALTQTDFAAQSGVSLSTIAKIEAFKTNKVSAQVLYKLNKILNKGATII